MSGKEPEFTMSWCFPRFLYKKLKRTLVTENVILIAQCSVFTQNVF